MNVRFLAWTWLGLAAMSVSAWAQQPYPSQGPDQPVRPQVPTLTPRAAQQPPSPPFQLTPQEDAQVDRALNLWEQRNRDIKTFDCKFKRWTYDAVFGKSDQPMFVDFGVLKFATPDRGLFRIETTEKDGREIPIEDTRSEYWICDGKSVFECKPVTKQVVETKVPPELRGRAIADGPLPFLFMSDAKKLKQRYFIRTVTPSNVQGQVWLEVYPRFQQDAANFKNAHFIIMAQGMSPFALRLVPPGGKEYTVYQFFDIVLNDPLKWFRGDPFRPYVPQGWQLVPDTSPAAQAGRPANAGRR